jgi:hypothetical protein
MPWVWVALVLVVWIAAALSVVVLCMSVRQIDTRLGSGRREVRYAKRRKPRPDTRAKVE